MRNDVSPFKEKRILIIRSVSFQQLDKNLVQVKETFSGQEVSLYLLTHSHGVERGEKYGIFTGVIDYESPGDFSFFHLPNQLKKEKFQAVIVPVSNQTGAGFLNVFALALRIRPREIYCCTPSSDIRLVPRKEIITRLLKAGFFSAAAAVFTLVSLVILPFLILPALLFKKSTRKPQIY